MYYSTVCVSLKEGEQFHYLLGIGDTVAKDTNVSGSLGVLSSLCSELS